MENMLVKPDKENSALADAQVAKAAQEVQAALVIAKRFPRDENQAITRILTSCKRTKLAENALYTYKRGGALVEGPSIRLAEVLLQSWGNVEAGVREIFRGKDYSEVQAYAWDMETNSRDSKTFRVSHYRYSRSKGDVLLTQDRDIYEHVANMGARRKRACILAIIPGDIVELAVSEINKTLAGDNSIPLEDKIRSVVAGFKEIGVTQEMLEKRLGHKIEVTTATEVVSLRKIYRSINDGMAGREAYFDMPKVDENEDLNEKLNKERESNKPQGVQTELNEFNPMTNDQKNKILNCLKNQKLNVPETEKIKIRGFLESNTADFESAQDWISYLEENM